MNFSSEKGKKMLELCQTRHRARIRFSVAAQKVQHRHAILMYVVIVITRRLAHNKFPFPLALSRLRAGASS